MTDQPASISRPVSKKSTPVLRICDILRTKDIPHTCEVYFGNCRDKRPLPFDIMIYASSMGLIEYDGEQHFDCDNLYNKDKTTLLKTQQHDLIKIKFCAQHGIPLLRICNKDITCVEHILNRFIYDLACRTSYILTVHSGAVYNMYISELKKEGILYQIYDLTVQHDTVIEDAVVLSHEDIQTPCISTHVTQNELSIHNEADIHNDTSAACDKETKHITDNQTLHPMKEAGSHIINNHKPSCNTNRSVKLQHCITM